MLWGFSPSYSATLGIVTCLVISWFRNDTRITPKRFVEAARTGTENSLKIGATVGVIGIIIGVLTYSGLLPTFADIVIELAGGSLILTILLIALASLILGMGVPVTAAYLITAVVAVPGSRCCTFCRKFRRRWTQPLKDTSAQKTGKKLSSITLRMPEKPLPAREEITWPLKKS